MRDRLASFEVYKLACEIFTLFFDHDAPILMKDARGRALVDQQVESLDSIAANIEEGYGRGFGKEWPQFLRIARGSARESKGRYLRLRSLLGERIVAARLQLLDRIIGGLTRTILTAEKKLKAAKIR